MVKFGDRMLELGDRMLELGDRMLELGNRFFPYQSTFVPLCRAQMCSGKEKNKSKFRKFGKQSYRLL